MRSAVAGSGRSSCTMSHASRPSSGVDAARRVGYAVEDPHGPGSFLTRQRLLWRSMVDSACARSAYSEHREGKPLCDDGESVRPRRRPDGVGIVL